MLLYFTLVSWLVYFALSSRFQNHALSSRLLNFTLVSYCYTLHWQLCHIVLWRWLNFHRRSESYNLSRCHSHNSLHGFQGFRTLLWFRSFKDLQGVKAVYVLSHWCRDSLRFCTRLQVSGYKSCIQIPFPPRPLPNLTPATVPFLSLPQPFPSPPPLLLPSTLMLPPPPASMVAQQEVNNIQRSTRGGGSASSFLVLVTHFLYVQ